MCGGDGGVCGAIPEYGCLLSSFSPDAGGEAGDNGKRGADDNRDMRRVEED